jgi:multidrug efflux system membrane fusion protein
MSQARRYGASPLAAIVLFTAGCHAAAPYQKPPTPVLVQDVRLQPTGRSQRYSAVVEPLTRTDLAFRVPGYVTALAQVEGRNVQEGDSVSAGTILASVRAEDYEAKIRLGQAALAEARAARGAASEAFARAEALYAARSLTRPEFEQARAALESIDARMAGVQAQIREAELARGDADLRAPFTGVVLRRHVEIGSLAAPGMPAFTLAETRMVRVVIGVPDTTLQRFPPGATERLSSDALPGRRFEGRVTKVSPTADQRSRLFDVELTVPNADGALRPGMVATVDVSRAAGASLPDALTVPLSAVVRAPGGEGGYAVYVLDDAADGPTARLRAIRLGDLVGNEIAVVQGLAQGDRVIVRGATIVVDGDRVNPTR